MKKIKTISSIVLFAILAACATKSINAKAEEQQPDSLVTSIVSLDIERYMGKWYEIGKLPMFFQRKCAKNTSANYSLQNDGTVEVVNYCISKVGEAIKAKGAATQTEVPAQLKVSFAPSWVQKIPLVGSMAKANYWVLKLDDEYQYALVGTPDHKYLWLLSRSKRVPDVVYSEYLAAAKAQGYQLKDWQPTTQE